MSRVKTGNSKKSFIREHDCRFCLYYVSCAHKECIFDGEVGDNGHEGGDGGSERGADAADAT